MTTLAFIRKNWVLGVIILMVLVLVFFAERQYQAKTCTQLMVKLSGTEVPLVREQDIADAVTRNGQEPVEGAQLSGLNLAKLERRVLENKLVKSCELYRDLQGNLVADVVQHDPVARLVNTTNDGAVKRASGGYYSSEGVYLPLSASYTKRVVLLSGAFFNNNRDLTHKDFVALREILQQIAGNPFWKAQISQIIIQKNGELLMIPQVGEHIIEFGSVDNYTDKFSKLKIFYDQILPTEGWNSYSKVSIKYKNQIVCEPENL